MNNKIVLILGGTGSIGGAVADILADNGFKVLRHGRKGKYKADVTKKAETRRLIKNVLAEYGRVDVLVNSLSAPVTIAGFEKKRWRDFEKHFRVQLKAAVDAASLVLPQMKKRGGGKIINILTSYVAQEPPASLSDYVVAKYALWGLTRAMAKDLARYNVQVNAVSPDLINNRFNRNLPAKLVEIIKARTPGGRLTTPQDVAKAVLFLVSKKADKITGKNFIISGGKVKKQ